MRVKIIRQHKRYNKGDIATVTPNVGFGLIDAGYAIVSKDITQQDIRTANGNSTQLRPMFSSRRERKSGTSKQQYTVRQPDNS